MLKQLFFLLLVSVSLSAQSTADIKKITDSYDQREIKILKEKLIQKQVVRQNKIDNFISANPSYKEVFFIEDRKYQIVDIIEGKPVYRTTDNANAAKALKTNRLYPGASAGLSLDGDGMSMAMWDGGWVLRNHNEFNNAGTPKVTCPDAPVATPEADGHATHVAGTICAKGAVSSAKGMSPKASLRSYDWTNDIIEVTAEASTNGLLFSNHSYGVPIFSNGEMQLPNWSPGCYNEDARDWDGVLYNNPYYLMVCSAGNEGNESYSGGLGPGMDKLTGEKNSKNNLVIANADPTVHPVTGNMTALVINPSSSQGPSDDGRIKPDVAGDGTNLYSSWNTGNAIYETLTGTSMASPNVAGTLLLLQQHYRNSHPSYMRSSTVKALVCHTALDDSAIPGPDPKFGYGLVDALAAANVITQSNSNQAVILESTLANGSEYSFTFSSTGTTPIKATLCWIDPKGTSKAGVLNSTSPALVNDLDLKITRNTETYFPWKNDLSNLADGAIKGNNSVDNLEKVEIDDAEIGTYTVTVSHKGALTSGPQAYSLILSGTNLLLGVDKIESAVLGLWPNPASSTLNVTVSDASYNWHVTVVDVQGRVLSSQNVTSYNINNKTFSVDVSQLPAGVYLLNLDNGSEKISKKFVRN